MSDPSVIDGIAVIISIIYASISLFDSSLTHLELSESFRAVRRGLPVIAKAFQTCKDEFEPVKESIPANFGKALETILDNCDDNASKIRRILENISYGESHTWEKRYSKFIRTFACMEKIEALMKSIAKDVKSIFDAHAVLDPSSEQNAELDKVIGEMRALMAFSFQRPFGICLGHVPFLSTEFFVGRDDGLATVANKLDSSVSTSELQRLVLGGIRGVGKTQLALAYAHSRSGGHESVFWLNAASENILRQSFQSLAEMMFVEVPKEHSVIKLVHDWLSDATNPRWLLIFDGYNDPNQFNIEDYYPPASHGAIIVTTRQPELVKGTAIYVKPLEKLEDSLRILQNRSRREDVQSDHHARLLAIQLAGLPLDLTIAGTYLRNNVLSFERYLQEYKKFQNCNLNSRRPVKLPDYQERKF